MTNLLYLSSHYRNNCKSAWH